MALRALGFSLTKAQVAELLQRYGDPLSNIGLPGFLALSKDAAVQLSPNARQSRLFELFDVLERECINLESLRLVAAELRLQHVSDKDLLGMINEFDTDKGGCISEVKFAAIMHSADIAV